MKKVINIIFSTMFYIFVLVMLVAIANQILPTEKSIELFGFKTYIAADTKSMEPMIQSNDLVVVKRASYDSITVGDTIGFSGTIGRGENVSKVPIVHKVISTNYNDSGEKRLFTQGINKETNPHRDLRPTSIDGSNNSNKYLGKYAFKIPKVGYIKEFITSIYGIVVIVVNLVIYIAIKYLVKE